MLNIFDYTDYRKFLNDYYKLQKKNKPSYSHTVFSRSAQIKSNSFVRMVMAGQRNLLPGTIHKYIKALGLNRKEALFFETLVFFNQTTDEKEKDNYFERLASLSPPLKSSKILKEFYEYLTHRHYIIIREMTALSHFHEDYSWIASQLDPPLTVIEAKKAVKVLLKLGLLTRDENNKLVHSRLLLETPPGVAAIEIQNYHRTLLNEASVAILNIPHHLRDVEVVTFPVAAKQVVQIKQTIQKCCDEILTLISKGGQPFSDIYQLNVQFYPVTRNWMATEKEKT